MRHATATPKWCRHLLQRGPCIHSCSLSTRSCTPRVLLRAVQHYSTYTTEMRRIRPLAGTKSLFSSLPRSHPMSASGSEAATALDALDANANAAVDEAITAAVEDGKWRLVNEAQSLYSMRLSIKKEDGETVTLTTVFQDTLPSGSALGTVVCMHGSPGSHNDFKYITPFLVKKGIRVIAINFPGFGLSEDASGLQFDNTERNNFVQAHLSALGISSRAIFLGHSRGTQNALQLTALNQDHAIGAVLVNPTGLRPHQGSRPMAQFTFWSALYDWLPPLRPLFHYMFQYAYNFVGLKVPHGRVAAVGIKTMKHLTFETQLATMEKVMSSASNQRVLFACSGRDWIIEKEIYDEFAETLRDRVHLECKGKSEEEERTMTEQMNQAFKSGHRSVSAFFAEDNHFVQKHRASFLAEGVIAIFESSTS